MRKILDQLVQRKPAQSKAPEQSEPRAHWQRSGHIYYLLDTLKLSYESHCGRVTYEKISVDSLHDLCDEEMQVALNEMSASQELPPKISSAGLCKPLYPNLFLNMEDTPEALVHSAYCAWQIVHSQHRRLGILIQGHVWRSSLNLKVGRGQTLKNHGKGGGGGGADLKIW